MDTRTVCQQLLDHIVEQLPEEREAALGLAALATFHPEEVRLFITEAMVLLMRNGCPVPTHLAQEVSARLVGGSPLEPLEPA